MDWKAVIRALLDTGLSVADIADEIGVTANAVREITAGRTKAPRAEAAFRLQALHALRCSPRAA